MPLRVDTVPVRAGRTQQQDSPAKKPGNLKPLDLKIVKGEKGSVTKLCERKVKGSGTTGGTARSGSERRTPPTFTAGMSSVDVFPEFWK